MAVMAVLAGSVEARQTQTFRSSLDLVTVDAAVHDGEGRPIPSLTRDFRLV
jgi:hypothetical protein